MSSPLFRRCNSLANPRMNAVRATHLTVPSPRVLHLPGGGVDDASFSSRHWQLRWRRRLQHYQCGNSGGLLFRHGHGDYGRRELRHRYRDINSQPDCDGSRPMREQRRALSGCPTSLTFENSKQDALGSQEPPRRQFSPWGRFLGVWPSLPENSTPLLEIAI